MTDNNELFPEAEARTIPEDPFEQLREEMQLYATPDDFRANLIGLGRLYEKTPLLRGFQRSAVLAAVADRAKSVPSAEHHPSFDDNFYSGEMLGMHCQVRPLPPEIRRRLYMTDPLTAVIAEDDDEDSSRMVGLIDNFHTTAWEDVFNVLDEPHKELLMEAAIRMSDGKDNSAGRENSFLAGFIFALVSINNML